MIILLYIYLGGFSACEIGALSRYADENENSRVATKGEVLFLETLACVIWPVNIK